MTTPPPPPPPPPSSPSFQRGNFDSEQHVFPDLNFPPEIQNQPPSKSHYDLNSKIMLTAIISLSIVVVFVILLHIYARCVLRRQARRRRIISSLGLTVHSAEPPKTGLDPMVIASLPTFVYQQKDGEEDEAASPECAVCLSALEDEELVRLLPNCKHTFHAQCIDRWLSSHSTCPICRAEAQPYIAAEPREGPVLSGALSTGGGAANAPPLMLEVCIEGASSSDGGNLQSPAAKVSGSSSSRLSSFRRMLSRERSSRRMNQSTEIQEEGFEDVERQ